MAMFSAVVSAKLAGRTVSRLWLAHLDFEGAPKHVFLGHGKINTLDGQEWDGIGTLVSIEGLGSAVGMAATPLKFTLSGVNSDIIALASAEADLVNDRRCIVYLQFFDEDTGELLDNPYAIRTGIMDVLSFDAVNPNNWSISVSAEGNWTNRKRPAYSLYTDRDQTWRHPGDRGLEQVADLVNRTVRWPIF